MIFSKTLFLPGIPLYHQLKQQLLTMIREGRHFDGNALSDHSLARDFGVSRITVRKALQDLVDEGILYRIQGIGTFVRQKKLQEKLTLTSFLEPWASELGRLDVRVGEFSRGSADRETAAHLGLAPGAEVVYIKRLRYRSDKIVAVDERFLRPENCNHLTTQQIMSSSLVDYLRDREGIRLDHGIMEIEAKSANRAEADQLGVRKGHALLVRKLVIYAPEDKPILAGTSIYRADLISYRLTLSSQV